MCLCCRYVSRVCGGSQEFSRERGGKRNHWVVGSNKKHYSHHVRELGSEERGRGRGKRGLGGRRGRGERKPRNEHARKVKYVHIRMITNSKMLCFYRELESLMGVA